MKTQKTRKVRKGRAVLQLDLITGEVIAEYESVGLAEKKTDTNSDSISAVCNGKRGHLSAGGYRWIWVA